VREVHVFCAYAATSGVALHLCSSHASSSSRERSPGSTTPIAARGSKHKRCTSIVKERQPNSSNHGGFVRDGHIGLT